jgi:hypothetical protein
MTIPETVLTFVGAPLAIIAVITLLVLGPGELKKPARYRPGRPWRHSPAWYLPHEITDQPAHRPTHPPPPGAAPQLPAARDASAFGGASGEW